MIKEQEFIKNINNPFLKYASFEEDKKVLGYIEYNLIYDRIEIVNILVDPSSRKKGIGTKLIKYLIEKGKENNCINITLEVKKGNIPALKLYEKNNFKRIAVRESYYNGVDGILMELEL